MNDKNLCRICGWFESDEFFPWGEDGLTPSYENCDCCGCEFGYHDYYIDYELGVAQINPKTSYILHKKEIDKMLDYRNKWLKNGAKWQCQKTKPAD